MRLLFIIHYLWIPIYKCIVQIISDYVTKEYVKRFKYPFFLPLTPPIITNDIVQENSDKYYEYMNHFLNTIPEHIPILRNKYYRK